MGRLNSTIIDDKKCFIAGQCFIATVREIVTPTHTQHSLFLITTRCFGGLGYISKKKSVDFRCFDWCDYFYQKEFPLIPLHTQNKNYYQIQTNMDNFKSCNVKRNLTLKIKHPRWAMGKGSGGGAAGLWSGQRRCRCRFDQLGKGRRRAARGRRRDGSEIKRVLQSVAL